MDNPLKKLGAVDYRRLARKHKNALSTTYQIGLLAILTLCAALLLLPKEADGEGDIMPQVKIVREKQSLPTTTTETPVKAKSSPTEPTVKLPADKEAIRQMIIDEMTKAGYKAPLFAVRVAVCESGLRPDAVGDSGKSYGLWQIHLPSHPDLTKEFALDPVLSTKWAANMFAKGYAFRWTCARILSSK